jgi:hypothetical protein
MVGARWYFLDNPRGQQGKVVGLRPGERHMIGGQDIHIGVPSGAAALGAATQVVSVRWPRAVFAIDGKLVRRCADLDLHDSSEVVIYRDMAACEAWRETGYDDSLKGTMIYLICDPTNLTLVVEDDPSPETRVLVKAIQDGLASVGGRRAGDTAAA